MARFWRSRSAPAHGGAPPRDPSDGSARERPAERTRHVNHAGDAGNRRSRAPQPRRSTMTSRIAIALATASFGIAGAVLPDAAIAQTAAELVGTWAVVSVDNVSPDGKRSPAFGPNPKGVVILDGNGRYVEVILQSNLPPIAAGNRMQGTAEENRAI